MTQHSRSITQGARKAPPSPADGRISAILRHAVTLHVKEGHTWESAAATAGMSESGLHKARQKPHVQAFIEQVKAEFVQDVAAMRAPFKAEAFQHARYLMRHAKSEAVQMRAVEFLGREDAPASSPSVQVNVISRGYEYVRPGQDVVTIEGRATSPDDASQADDSK